MKALDAMLSADGGAVVNQIAGQFGVNTEQAATAISTLMPAMAGGVKERLASGDTSGISDLLTRGGFTQFSENPSTLSTQNAVDQGNALLERIFGPENTSHLIEMAADKLGISRDVIARMLPVVASLLGAFLAKKAATGESLHDLASTVSGAGHGIAGAVRTFTSKFFS